MRTLFNVIALVMLFICSWAVVGLFLRAWLETSLHV